MSNRYKHLLSPLRIGNVVLKNRLLSSNASPHFLQGPETFPAEPFLAYNTNLAKNGAAVITLAEWSNPKQRTGDLLDGLHMQSFDLNDPSVHNYMAQLADDIHFYGSKLIVSANISDPSRDRPVGNPGGGEMTAEQLAETIDRFVEKLKLYKSFGYDGVSLGLGIFIFEKRKPAGKRKPEIGSKVLPVMDRHANFLHMGAYLSTKFNTRTDEYGGSLENRARFPLQLCRRIKEKLGRDFLIEAVMAGEEHEGYTITDTVAFARMAEGIIDIFQLRESDTTLSHPTGFTFKPGEHKTLQYAEALKNSGVKVIVEPIGGYHDPDEIEGYLASGKADMIGMARTFISDPEYGRKLYEGNGEDVVPCILCNKCHGIMSAPWLSFCSVNPVMGIEHKLGRMVEAPGEPQKIAVIGGGPAGMEAAIVAARRGHKVTLYEQNAYLGGQLIHGDYASFKWPIKKFREYLIRQMDKLGVTVKLSTQATPAMIQAAGFDTVVAATGAEPNLPDIPGISESKVWTCPEVYGRERELGKKVVIVGGTQIGVETGMYLAENGHDVTVLTRQDRIAHDASPIHSITQAWVSYENDKEIIRAAWEKLANFTGIVRATTTAVAVGCVTYRDADGNTKTITTDSIVICGGMNPRQAEAMSFSGTADRYFIIGDCDSVGNIQRCIRSAYAAASRI